MKETNMKYTESQIPAGLTARVRYHTKGQYTTCCWLVDDHTKAIVARGIAKCHPNDTPSRKIGRAIAIGRALKAYDESYTLRLPDLDALFGALPPGGELKVDVSIIDLAVDHGMPPPARPASAPAINMMQQAFAPTAEELARSIERLARAMGPRVEESRRPPSLGEIAASVLKQGEG